MTSNDTSITRYSYYRTNDEDVILGLAQDGETVLAIYRGVPSDRRARWIDDIANGDVADYADLDSERLDDLTTVEEFERTTPGAYCLASTPA